MGSSKGCRAIGTGQNGGEKHPSFPSCVNKGPTRRRKVPPPMLPTATQHNTTQHNTTQHNTTQHNTTQHNTTQHNTTQHNTTQHNTTQHNTTPHHTTHHTTPQHHTTQHNTTQHKLGVAGGSPLAVVVCGLLGSFLQLPVSPARKGSWRRWGSPPRSKAGCVRKNSRAYVTVLVIVLHHSVHSKVMSSHVRSSHPISMLLKETKVKYAIQKQSDIIRREPSQTRPGKQLHTLRPHSFSLQSVNRSNHPTHPYKPIPYLCIAPCPYVRSPNHHYVKPMGHNDPQRTETVSALRRTFLSLLICVCPNTNPSNQFVKTKASTANNDMTQRQQRKSPPKIHMIQTFLQIRKIHSITQFSFTPYDTSSTHSSSHTKQNGIASLE